MGSDGREQTDGGRKAALTREGGTEGAAAAATGGADGRESGALLGNGSCKQTEKQLSGQPYSAMHPPLTPTEGFTHAHQHLRIGCPLSGTPWLPSIRPSLASRHSSLALWHRHRKTSKSKPW